MEKQRIQEINTVNQILKEISRLDISTQLLLAKKLLTGLKSRIKADSDDKSPLLELEGMGAEIWNDESVDEYIRKEREWD